MTATIVGATSAAAAVAATAATTTDPTAYLYGACGAVAAIGLACAGTAIGTMQSGDGILARLEDELVNNPYNDVSEGGGGSINTMDVESQKLCNQRQQQRRQQPPSHMKAMVPVVITGVLACYGLIVAVLIQLGLQSSGYNRVQGYLHLCSGLSVGIPCLFSGVALGHVGRYVRKGSSFVALVLILIFAEALGLYGLIVALVFNKQAALAGGAPSPN